MDCLGYENVHIFLGEEICRKEICQPKKPHTMQRIGRLVEIVFKVARKSSQESSQEMPEHVSQFKVND